MQNIILQGKYHNRLQEIINCIRNWFDGRLIISMWKENIDNNLKYVDDIFLLDDIGSGPKNNINRQIFGTLEVLKKCDFKDDDLIFRSRNDILFKENVFNHYKYNLPIEDKWAVFRNRIMMSTIMTMNFEMPPEYRCINPSDWFQLGSFVDIYRYFNIFPLEFLNIDFCCEQLWFVNIIKKYLGLYIDKKTDKDVQWKLFINNFQFVNNNRTLKSYSIKYVNEENLDNSNQYICEELIFLKEKVYYG